MASQQTTPDFFDRSLQSNNGQPTESSIGSFQKIEHHGLDGSYQDIKINPPTYPENETEEYSSPIAARIVEPTMADLLRAAETGPTPLFTKPSDSQFLAKMEQAAGPIEHFALSPSTENSGARGSQEAAGVGIQQNTTKYNKILQNTTKYN